MPCYCGSDIRTCGTHYLPAVGWYLWIVWEFYNNIVAFKCTVDISAGFVLSHWLVQPSVRIASHNVYLNKNLIRIKKKQALVWTKIKQPNLYHNKIYSERVLTRFWSCLFWTRDGFSCFLKWAKFLVAARQSGFPEYTTMDFRYFWKKTTIWKRINNGFEIKIKIENCQSFWNNLLAVLKVYENNTLIAHERCCILGEYQYGFIGDAFNLDLTGWQWCRWLASGLRLSTYLRQHYYIQINTQFCYIHNREV